MDGRWIAIFPILHRLDGKQVGRVGLTRRLGSATSVFTVFLFLFSTIRLQDLITTDQFASLFMLLKPCKDKDEHTVFL